MVEKRIIKKYPDRRLYDTGISSYITLEDVKNLVMNGIDFTVIDVKTKEDLTRIILAYGNTSQYFLSDYLSRCLGVTEITEHNLKVWKNITDSFFKQDRFLSLKTNQDN